MTNKDYYMMGVKNCMLVLGRCLLHGGVTELLSTFAIPSSRFDEIASIKFDEFHAVFVESYQKEVESAKNRPTQSEGNA